MEISKILNRIGLDDNRVYEPSFENLKLLKKSYLLHIPYENLDFVLKRGLNTNILKIYEKIVENSRGGICYESNTLFAYLLKSLDYNVKMIFAKVDDLSYIGYGFPHLALLVNIDDIDYLVDVGNGQNIREPLDIEDGNYISLSESKEYKIEKKENIYTLLINYKNKRWLPRYSFTKNFISVSDFENIFKDREDSLTDGPLLVTQALDNGRATLMDEIMVYSDGNDRKIWNVSKENRAEVLRDYFNIELDFSNKL